MVSSRLDVGIAIAVSVVLHVFILALVGFSWSSNPELVRPPKLPSFVQAVVMEQPKPAQAKAPVQPKPQPKPEAKPEPRPKPKPPEAVTKPQPKPDPEPKDEPKPDIEPEPEPRLTQTDLAEMMAMEDLDIQETNQVQLDEPTDQETAPGETVEQGEQQADEDAQAVSSYTDAISAAISRRWIIPATARDKTELAALVRVHLLPGGEVLDVKLVEPSGDSSFDNSALAAVRSAGKLPVPTGELFNEKFRVFTFRFYPGLKAQ